MGPQAPMMGPQNPAMGPQVSVFYNNNDRNIDFLQIHRLLVSSRLNNYTMVIIHVFPLLFNAIVCPI